MQKTITQKIYHFYEQHEERLSLAFFLGGFVFDVFTLSDIDDPFSILQQVAYLGFMGFILAFDFIWGSESKLERGPKWASKVWDYRALIFHFFLGSLLSVYSLFFLKSASFFSSSVFVACLLGLMVANEMKSVQNSGLNLKISLYVICVFCFFSLLIPVLLGFVGRIPFLLSLAATLLVLWQYYRLLRGRVGTILLKRRLLFPGVLVSLLFTLFYLIGWIPPVPISTQKMGIYHKVEKVGDVYKLYHERPWWKFWRSGDQDFKAAPGDKVNFFVGIFSPGRFDDSVILHWALYDARRGWQSTDKIPMRITGGRKAGYRGTATKQNFQPGDWRVGVETTDGREIGRMYFSVEAVPAPLEERKFETEEY